MTQETNEFDFSAALKAIQEGKPLLGREGILTPLIKNLTEAALEGELDSHLGQELNSNRRNGKSRKTIKSLNGNFELQTPRDRDGTFSPQLVKKHQTSLNDEIEQKIIAMYGVGLSYQDISGHLRELYGLEVSTGTLSAITDKIIQTVKEWQGRPLASTYPIVWLDAIHYKVRENGKVTSKAVYTILGVNLEGHKEVLGLYISEHEGANFWLQVLTDLSNRGVKDILIACVDGLKGFPEAIEAIFPETEVQLCVVHQIRNSLKYVGSKNQKEFMADLKRVYRASSKDLAASELDILADKWNDKYPIVIKSWRNNWERLSQYFKYPADIRRIMYTTNTIEAVHRQFRKLTKTKGAFPNQDSLLKLLYMGIQNASRKWTMPIQNWSLTISQLAIFFAGRLDKELEL
ncbi:MAG TPA: IS256 family transposase [Methylomicrobium sp.]|nr:IS256 family transposase [Methylomicrobium sp.]